jgi:hypothetical protein
LLDLNEDHEPPLSLEACVYHCCTEQFLQSLYSTLFPLSSSSS